MQPLLHNRAEGDDVLPGLGQNSVSHEIQLKGKHFPTRFEKRTRCNVCGHKRNRNGKYKDIKTSIFPCSKQYLVSFCVLFFSKICRFVIISIT